jgi:TRAP-type C4-dicarboxylate transport system substrate-binding protein
MNIELEKSKLMKLLEETNDESIIASMMKLFKTKKKDFWDDLSEEQQNILNESLEQYEKGEFTSFEKFINPHL